MTQEEILKLESNEKLLTEYSKYLEKRGYMDSDWWCEENTVEDFLGIK
jgi:hypothetical protein